MLLPSPPSTYGPLTFLAGPKQQRGHSCSCDLPHVGVALVQEENIPISSHSQVGWLSQPIVAQWAVHESRLPTDARNHVNVASIERDPLDAVVARVSHYEVLLLGWLVLIQADLGLQLQVAHPHGGEVLEEASWG